MSRNEDRVEIQEYDEDRELWDNIQHGARRSVCGGLILRVNEYLKKPRIDHDLSTILSTYLDVLQQSSICLQKGTFNLNFAEAALLLNSVVQMYGKKVDLLWDFTIEYLNRNMSYEEKTVENHSEFILLEECKRKFKRKRKILEPNEDGQQPKISRNCFIVDKSNAQVQGMHFEDFQSFMATIKDTHATTDSSITNYEENWKNRCTTNEQCTNSKNIRPRRGDTITTTDIENLYFTNNLLSIKLHAPAILQYDLSERNMYDVKEPLGDYGSSSTFDQINREFTSHNLQVNHHNISESQVACYDVQDLVLQSYIIDRQTRIGEVYTQWDEFLNECKDVANTMYSLKTKPKDLSGKHGILTCFYQEPANAIPGKTVTPVEGRLEIELTEIPQEEKGNDMHAKRNDPVRLTKDTDIESGVFDTLSTIAPGRDNDGKSLSIYSEGIDMGSPGQDAVGSRSHTPGLGDDSGIPDLGETMIEEVGHNALKKTGKTVKTRLKFEDLDEDGNVIVKPKRKRRVKIIPQIIITADLNDFNRFFRQHYTPSNGEGELEPYQDDPIDDNDDLGDMSYFDSVIDSTNFSDTSFLTSTQNDKNLPAIMSSTPPEEAQINTEDGPPHCESNDKSFADIMCQDATTRIKHVLDWKSFIMEKISKKTVFNIHDEETSVINTIGEVGKSVKYKDICMGKSSADVTRNFAAMLHLLNTHNVAFSGIKPGKLSEDTLEVKLISTDRHHEHLDQYKDSHAESMHRLKDRNDQKRHNEGSYTSSSSKKVKK